MKRLFLHWQILIGMVLGVMQVLFFSHYGLNSFCQGLDQTDWDHIYKLAETHCNPLILVSLIKVLWICMISSKFKMMGIRTFIFMFLLQSLPLQLDLFW